MAFWARKVFGSFEKRTPGVNFSRLFSYCISSAKKTARIFFSHSYLKLNSAEKKCDS